MIFLIVVTNGYVLVTLIGASAENHAFCFALRYEINVNIKAIYATQIIRGFCLAPDTLLLLHGSPLRKTQFCVQFIFVTCWKFLIMLNEPLLLVHKSSVVNLIVVCRHLY